MEDGPPRLAFIAGGDVRAMPPFTALSPEIIQTRYGTVTVHVGDELVLLLRHGERGSVPPHRVAHEAHFTALSALGIQRVVALCSVGSLREDIVPGTLLIPDDFGQLGAPATLHDDDARHVVPRLSSALRVVAVEAAGGLGRPIHDGGVYWQTHGPRLETRAEVRLLSRIAHVVGMTFGHEATLACEAGMEVAAVCSVDNMAHGLPDGDRLDAAQILARKADTAALWASLAARLLRATRGAQPHSGEIG